MALSKVVKFTLEKKNPKIGNFQNIYEDVMPFLWQTTWKKKCDAIENTLSTWGTCRTHIGTQKIKPHTMLPPPPPPKGRKDEPS